VTDSSIEVLEKLESVNPDTSTETRMLERLQVAFLMAAVFDPPPLRKYAAAARARGKLPPSPSSRAVGLSAEAIAVLEEGQFAQ